MSLFRTRQSASPQADSPAGLFRDLRRSPEVKFLWAHQEKLLDTYYREHLASADVALELPTGSGKTLVGLLIAEYRRRARSERVAYLCPTRQLCKQVMGHATDYGIRCSLLVGKQRDYDVHAFTSYQRAQAIAITTYSGIFNVNPALSDAEVIVCDDAHASEEYIAGLWSLRITRHAYPLIFQGMVDLLGDAIPPEMRRRIGSEEPGDRFGVDLVPGPRYDHA